MSTKGLIYLCVIAYALAYLVFYIPVHFNFKSFCRKVATAQGRLDEFHAEGRDEGGLNEYEQDVFWSIVLNDYSTFEDAEIALQAGELRRKFRVSFVLAFGLALLISAVIIWSRGCADACR
jgi:hypothetical protein